MTDRRRTFGRVVGPGVAAAALAAVAGARPWVGAADAAPDRHAPLPRTADMGEMPLALALGLVLLACWGVLLVTRGPVRRGVAVLALLASLGLVATVCVGFATLPDQLAETLSEDAAGVGTVGTEVTVWFWVAAVASLVSVAASALAVAWCTTWPEMGSRYDAPGAGTPGEAQTGEQSPLDLWRSMDEGRDPTA